MAKMAFRVNGWGDYLRAEWSVVITWSVSSRRFIGCRYPPISVVTWVHGLKWSRDRSWKYSGFRHLICILSWIFSRLRQLQKRLPQADNCCNPFRFSIVFISIFPVAKKVVGVGYCFSFGLATLCNHHIVPYCVSDSVFDGNADNKWK